MKSQWIFRALFTTQPQVVINFVTCIALSAVFNTVYLFATWEYVPKENTTAHKEILRQQFMARMKAEALQELADRA